MECAIRKVQANEQGLKFNDTHQFVVYIDDLNLLGESICTTKKNSGALFVASKDVGLEVNDICLEAFTTTACSKIFLGRL